MSEQNQDWPNNRPMLKPGQFSPADHTAWCYWMMKRDPENWDVDEAEITLDDEGISNLYWLMLELIDNGQKYALDLRNRQELATLSAVRQALEKAGETSALEVIEQLKTMPTKPPTQDDLNL